jgi:mono/diheme cytochrome c family protein
MPTKPMRLMLKGALIAALVLAVTGALAAFAYIKTTGLSARAAPGAVETALARRLRTWAVPSGYRDLRNPVLRNDESVRNGMDHFADHCASCHANDGSGENGMGKDMFPPAPDMRQGATQELTDGELFYIIEHGVRFTGMPAWSTGTVEGEEASWHLVHFIRHLPNLTAEEMEAMEAINPRPPAEIRQEIEAERFLQGNDVTAQPAVPNHGHGSGHE